MRLFGLLWLSLNAFTLNILLIGFFIVLVLLRIIR